MTRFKLIVISNEGSLRKSSSKELRGVLLGSKRAKESESKSKNTDS